MLTAHLEQLHRVRDLNTGLEWVAMCPDERARQALLQLVGEEMGAVLSGVIYAAETDARPAQEVELAHSA